MANQSSQRQADQIGNVTALNSVSDEVPPRRFFTLSKFSERHSSFLTLPAVTNQVFKANPRHSSKGEIPGNGMNDFGVIVRINGRVLIDEDRYFAWVDSLQKEGQ